MTGVASGPIAGGGGIEGGGAPVRPTPDQVRARSEAVMGREGKGSTPQVKKDAAAIKGRMEEMDAENLLNATDSTAPMDAAKGQAAIDRNYGTQRDDKGRRDFERGSDAKQRAKDEGKAQEFARSLQGRKVEEIDQELLAENFDDLIARNPGFEDFKTWDADLKRPVYADIISKPGFIRHLKEGYKTHTEKSQSQEEEALAQAELHKATTAKALELAAERQNRAKDEYDRIKGLQDRATGELNPRELQLRQIRANDRLKTATTTRDQIKATINKGSYPPDLDAKLAAAETELSEAQKEQVEVSSLIEERKSLPSDQTLAQRLQSASEARDKADEAYLKAHEANETAKREYSLALANKESAEIEYLAEAKGLAREAFDKFLKERNAQAEQASKAIMEEASKKAKDEEGKAMARIWERRHWQIDPKTKMPVPVQGSFTKEIERMFMAGGPEAITKQMLETYYNGKFEAEFKAQGLTGDSLRAEVFKARSAAVAEKMKDTEFMSSWNTKIGAEGYKGAIREGWRPTKDQLAYLEQAEWGQDILNALMETEEVRDFEAEARAKGILQENEKLKDKISKKGMLGLLLAIAAGAVLKSTGVIGFGYDGSKH